MEQQQTLLQNIIDQLNDINTRRINKNEPIGSFQLSVVGDRFTIVGDSGPITGTYEEIYEILDKACNKAYWASEDCIEVPFLDFPPDTFYDYEAQQDAMKDDGIYGDNYLNG